MQDTKGAVLHLISKHSLNINIFPLYYLNELLMTLRKSLRDTHKTQLKQFNPRQEF